MGIDGIGKPKGPAGTIPAGAPTETSKIGSTESFELHLDKTEGVQGTSPLDQLQAGKIDVDTYLDMKVQQATQFLEGKMAPEKLQWIRQTLRTQLQEDPTLADMVNRVTGSTTDGLSGSRG